MRMMRTHVQRVARDVQEQMKATAARFAAEAEACMARWRRRFAEIAESQQRLRRLAEELAAEFEAEDGGL